MRHRIAGRKLNRTSEHRMAMLSNMATSLFEHGQIRTTLPKAKTLRPFVERLITKAREQDGLRCNVIRRIQSKLHSLAACKNLIENVAPRYVGINGGYTRIVKCGYRYGDCAPMAIIQLVQVQQ